VLTESEECEKYHVPIVVATSSSPTLTNRGFKYIFRTWITDTIAAKRCVEFINYLKKETGRDITKIAVINADNLFGVDGYKAFIAANDEIGGYEVVEHITIEEGIVDATSEVARLKAADPDVLYMVVSAVVDCITLQQTFEKMDFNFDAIVSTSGHGGPEFKALGKIADYVFARTSYSEDIFVAKPHLQYIKDTYEDLAGKDLFSFPCGAYIDLHIVRQALENCGSTDPEIIRDAISEIYIPSRELPGPYPVKFDETGQNIYATPLITQLIDGAWRTVYPEDLQAVEPIFPQPTWDER
jgi:branched-chain amino acid transport system substrate-binding protein